LVTVNLVLTMLHSHDAQQGFCGEPDCVGFIGGKTQTDVGAVDDLYLDGISR
jgi:[histone H3]-lysine36 N-trimethyltransferase